MNGDVVPKLLRLKQFDTFYIVHPRRLNLISGQSGPRESHLCQPKTVIFVWIETCFHQSFGRRDNTLAEHNPEPAL